MRLWPLRLLYYQYRAHHRRMKQTHPDQKTHLLEEGYPIARPSKWEHLVFQVLLQPTTLQQISSDYCRLSCTYLAVYQGTFCIVTANLVVAWRTFDAMTKIRRLESEALAFGVTLNVESFVVDKVTRIIQVLSCSLKESSRYIGEFVMRKARYPMFGVTQRFQDWEALCLPCQDQPH